MDELNRPHTHQGIDQHVPERLHEPTPPPNYQLKGKVVATSVLNSLFHS